VPKASSDIHSGDPSGSHFLTPNVCLCQRRQIQKKAPWAFARAGDESLLVRPIHCPSAERHCDGMPCEGLPWDLSGRTGSGVVTKPDTG